MSSFRFDFFCPDDGENREVGYTGNSNHQESDDKIVKVIVCPDTHCSVVNIPDFLLSMEEIPFTWCKFGTNGLIKKSTLHENSNNCIDEYSDLIPGKYGGGYKVWECSLDLVEYLQNHDSYFPRSVVLLINNWVSS